ncbi:TadE/TadG family type IV pilus assembly protein [Donghicola mangrovi]|uniref:VWFA domain-containing protein n=1 Tax=Donghicola mangrovi TaxID=2729614 RepID=A0A850QG34_9RHOB|nr:pilus assembly protein TadG-related protein [Donghicola mangrovi]NVO24811.1 hypothetical protein [Donghicola mangrovi]
MPDRSLLATGLRRYCRSFASDESGIISLQFLWQFPFMLWFGYISIDVMMHEFERTRLQNTLDRAILAAADLDQTGDPETVVRSYFTAAGIENSLTSIIVTEGLNSRKVEATAALSVPTVFLNAEDAGYIKNYDTPYIYDPSTGESNNYKQKGSSLPAHAKGAAEETVNNVEISLVLDVSGSMANNGRIDRLHTAASDFVEAVVKESDVGMTTVSVVPYSAVVNVGTTLSPYIPMTAEHSYSTCASFVNSDFNSTALHLNSAYTRVAHFDPFTNDINSTEIVSPWCPTGNTAGILPYGSSVSSLQSYVQSLTAGGNTAIDVGMKWGAALLDPSVRSIISSLISTGKVDSDAAGRPAAFDDEETLKVIVLMTDGENTSQYDLRDVFKSGNSDIWVDRRGNGYLGDDRFSYNFSAYNSSTTYFRERFKTSDISYRYRSSPDGGSSADRMTYPEAFARWGTQAIAWKFFEQPYYDGKAPVEAFYNQYYAYEEKVNAAAADARLNTICTVAKNNDIVIFTVAFEAPEAGQIALKNCASTESHYFNVEGVEIEEVFSAIGRQINQLRLIQ